MDTYYVITQMGHWMVKECGGWTLKASEAKVFTTHDAALTHAYHMGRNDLVVTTISR